jgi:hypothetical protein
MLPALLALFGRSAQALTAQCRQMIAALLHPYRPELHYMRGPGPKWRARHGRVR